MAEVDSAEKEASEVLHTLLSVEKIEKQEDTVKIQPSEAFQTESTDGETQIQWHTPVSIAHPLFSTIDSNGHTFQNIDDQQVIWEGHAIVDPETNINTIYTATPVEDTDITEDAPKTQIVASKPKATPKTKKKTPEKKKKKVPENSSSNDPTKLEESAAQVKDRFKRGCECQDESCFRGLNPESVYKHRLNIAELTKGEHDMYLMGVTMACLANPDTTVRHKERRRLRAQYVYQGRRVCLDAFLYLENCTHYQLKRIRKHVMTHGVAPRVHGNHGKKPHNTFSLDIYKHATEFLKQYLEQHTGERDIVNTKQPIQLPWDVTRKNLHDAYKEYGQILEPGIKLMGYSTFRHFMKEQFPHVKFYKIEPKSCSSHHNSHNNCNNQQVQQNQQQQQQPQTHLTHQQQVQQQTQQIQTIERSREQIQQVQKCVINNEVQQVIPLVVTPSDSTTTQHHQQTFLVTPVPQLIPNGQLQRECEEYEMQNSVNSEPLGVNDVLELLQQQHAIISGGKSKDGCPIITFPDNNNFEMLSDVEYQRLMLYLTSVPSLHDADLGFHLIIDRRNDRWNSVKTVLLKISVYFPGLIHVVYVLKPSSFLQKVQKAVSEVSNKFFKDEFKFRMIVLNSIEELQKYVSLQQLTPDLGGTLPYCHKEWIQQRIQLETFSAITQQVSSSLDNFTKTIEETELPNDIESIQLLLESHNLMYSNLKKDILSAAKHGEDLLTSIKEKSLAHTDGCTPDNGNIFAIERLLVQLEETETTFNAFWQQHVNMLRNCIELRRFEQDFRELQINLQKNLIKVAEMADIGDTLDKVDNTLRQAKIFEKMCFIDIDRAEEVIAAGNHLINTNSCPIECVEPKCLELERIRKVLSEKLAERLDLIARIKMLMEGIENAEAWCRQSVDLLNSQKLEQCSNNVELTETYIKEIKDFLESSKEFASNNGSKNFENLCQDVYLPQIKAAVLQALEKVEDMKSRCNERILFLNKLANKPKRQNPIVPKQPQIGAPSPITGRIILKKAYTSPKLTSALDSNGEDLIQNISVSLETEENNKIKIGHILTELLETERVYVSELFSIIKGYKMEAQNPEMQHLVPIGVEEKFNVIFGNLEEIYQFHCDVFLKDLENCISSTDLVALCFLQKRDTFFQLYNFYCQNISKSEQSRESSTDLQHFFQACQLKLGHKLPLAAYLLKPVQRITKYQLLLKDLLRYSSEGECCKELQQALDCMLIVLKCLNDSMHQISITGFPSDLSQQGELLLQGAFSVWAESKKDLRLRIKPMHRHLFLYQKALLFCKPISKATPNKATYQYKHYLKMSQIGLTESVRGDPRRFEVWLQGRQEVHIIQAVTLEQKQTWVNEIKKVLFNQLEEIRIKQYALAHRPLRQTTSWEKQKNSIPTIPIIEAHNRFMSCDSEHPSHGTAEESTESIESSNWSSDGSNSDDEEHGIPSERYVALADYCAVGSSEVNMKEGDIVELLKVGCAGWWFVKVLGNNLEGWTPAAYLENLHYKSSRSNNSRSQDKLNV